MNDQTHDPNNSQGGGEELEKLGLFGVMEPPVQGMDPLPRVPHLLYDHTCSDQNS